MPSLKKIRRLIGLYYVPLAQFFTVTDAQNANIKYRPTGRRRVQCLHYHIRQVMEELRRILAPP